MKTADRHTSLAPSAWVVRWAGLLPAGATVLDLACGSGRHVRWLADRGFAVTAVDRDAAAVQPLRDIAGVDVRVADLEGQPWPLEGRHFDAIVITNYLWRPLWPRLIESLRPTGLLIHETFSVDQASIGKPSNPAFLLKHGELLERAAGLRILGYEDGFLTDPDRFVQRITAIGIPGHAMSAQAPRHPL